MHRCVTTTIFIQLVNGILGRWLKDTIQMVAKTGLDYSKLC